VEMKKLNLTATYTYFRSEFTDINGKYVSSSWDTKHLFNMIASYKLPKDWNVAIRWRFVGGAPYTPVDFVASKQKAIWDVTNQAVLDYKNFNSERLPNAHQLDMRIDKEFYFKNWVLNLYTDIQNVYNFKTQGAPIYTNLKENPVDSKDINVDTSGNYILRPIANFGGNILPTIGIIIKI